MVLAELGGRISDALKRMCDAIVIDEKVLIDCLNEVSRALLVADVQVNLVSTLQKNVKQIHKQLASGHNKRRIIQQVHFIPQIAFCFCEL